MTEITYLTKSEIDRRREELLVRAGLGLEELRERASHYQLSPEQSLILNELENLEFLAGAW